MLGKLQIQNKWMEKDGPSNTVNSIGKESQTKKRDMT